MPSISCWRALIRENPTRSDNAPITGGVLGELLLKVLSPPPHHHHYYFRHLLTSPVQSPRSVRRIVVVCVALQNGGILRYRERELLPCDRPRTLVLVFVLVRIMLLVLVVGLRPLSQCTNPHTQPFRASQCAFCAVCFDFYILRGGDFSFSFAPSRIEISRRSRRRNKNVDLLLLLSPRLTGFFCESLSVCWSLFSFGVKKINLNLNPN